MKENRLVYKRLNVGNRIAKACTCNLEPRFLGELTSETSLRHLTEFHTATRQPPILMPIGTRQGANEK
jgi:hypothetical protein